MLKTAIKHGAGEDQVRHRIVPTEIVSKWVEKLAELKDEISAILHDEKEEKHVRSCVLIFVDVIIHGISASTGRNGVEKRGKHDRT